MTTTWILVANRSGATIYAHTIPGPLALVREIPHPEGHLKNRELGDDKPGRSYQSKGTPRSAVGSDYEEKYDVAEDFARSLAHSLAHGRTDHAFDKLILMAEPRFLGVLRGALDTPTAATVIGSLPKDLPHATEPEIRERLRELLPV